jgi:hypothetical protein
MSYLQLRRQGIFDGKLKGSRVRSLLAGFNTSLIVKQSNTISENKQDKGISLAFLDHCAIISPL